MFAKTKHFLLKPPPNVKNNNFQFNLLLNIYKSDIIIIFYTLKSRK